MFILQESQGGEGGFTLQRVDENGGNAGTGKGFILQEGEESWNEVQQMNAE